MHHLIAGFRRNSATRLFLKMWACSCVQIPWVEGGFDGAKLPNIATGFGFFYDKHRAVSDCRAGIEILASQFPGRGVPAFALLLNEARRAHCRIKAIRSPFDLKDTLKARGYKWEPLDKYWYFDLHEESLDSEMHFLQTEIYGRPVELPIARFTALYRFSERV